MIEILGYHVMKRILQIMMFIMAPFLCSLACQEMEELDLNKSEWVEIGPFPESLKGLGFEKASFERKPFLVPKGTKLLSQHKPVTSNDDLPITGNLDMVTDGVWRPGVTNYVEIGPGFEWVQIDLGESCVVSAIVMWRLAGSRPKVFRDVVIATSDSEDFDQYEIIFNNDGDNSAGLGTGNDAEYVENPYGNIIDAKNVEARYIRVYSNGSYLSKAIVFVEIEVYGKQKNESQPALSSNLVIKEKPTTNPPPQGAEGGGGSESSNP